MQGNPACPCWEHLPLPARTSSMKSESLDRQQVYLHRPHSAEACTAQRACSGAQRRDGHAMKTKTEPETDHSPDAGLQQGHMQGWK